MRLLWFNLATDVDDPVLGFTSRWIQAIATKVERIHVITMRAGRIELPENVRCDSVGKEAGYSRPRRIVEFYRILLEVLRNEPVDACFSHMFPLFTVLAAPLLRPKGVPIVTWYTHPSLTLQLRLAHRLSDQMVTSLPSSYPYDPDKLRVLGHGIDTDWFAPDETRPQLPALILCAGRLSPVKDHVTLLKAVAMLRQRFRGQFQVMILGNPARPSDVDYRSSLKELARDLDIEDIVHFHDAVTPAELPTWYRRCAVHVNLTGVGFGDKVALESQACARPTLTANEDFRETLGQYSDQLLFRPGDPNDLSSRLLELLTLPEEKRLHMGRYLRERVVRLHGIEGLTERLVELLKSLGKDPPQ